MASTFSIPTQHTMFASPWRLFSVFGLLVLLPFGLFAWLALSQVKANSWRVATERNESIAVMGRQALRNHFSGMVDYVDLFAHRRDLAKQIEQQDATEIRRLLRNFIESSSAFSRVVISRTDGTMLYDYPVDPAATGRNFTQRDWYQGVRAGSDRPYLSRIYPRNAPDHAPVMAVAAAVRNEQGVTVAYVTAQHPINDLSRWVGTLAPSPGRQVMLADQRGQSLQSSSDRLVDWRDDPALAGVLKTAGTGDGGSLRWMVGGRAHLLSYLPVTPYGWTIAISQDENEILTSFRTQRGTLSTLALIVLAVLLPLAYLWFAALVRQRQATESSRSLLVGIMDSNRDATLAIDREGRILAANAAWLSGSEMLLGRAPRLGEVPGPVPGIDIVSLRRRAAQGEEFAELVRFDLGPMEGRSFEIKSSRLLDAAGQTIGAVLSSREYTARLEDERRISQLAYQLGERNQALEEANKELESFSYSVSHDLRSPLRAIDGFAGMLARRADPRLDDEDRRLLTVVRDSSKTMGRLIDDLLVFARMGRQAINPAMVDMTRLVEEVWQTVGLDFRGEFFLAPLPAAAGDRILLRQVWVNLLSNAVKYSGKRAVPRIEVSGEVDGDECRYHVRDNGAGFDMKYVGKLFGVFQRLHAADEFPGSGVGLAIIARVVGRHGGRAWAHGEIDAGATFSFSLPADAGERFDPLNEEDHGSA